MAGEQRQPPGAPGATECWTCGSKVGVGTALGEASSVWFTLGRGVIEELYYPTADHPRSRDLIFAVADGIDFFSCDNADADSQPESLEPGAPAYRIVNRCRRNRYRIEKIVFSHPDYPVVLQQTRWMPGANGDALHLYALFNSHLGREANHWLGDYKGLPMLFAEGEGAAIALACSLPWRCRTVGFVGVSDGWRDLKKHRRLTGFYDRAESGNAVLTGEVDTSGGEFLLAIAFGRNAWEAGFNARAALLQGWEAPLARYLSRWRDWQKAVRPAPTSIDRARAVYRASAAMLRVHEAKLPPGAAVASLSIPWGGARIGDKVGGYHLVWPRDLVEIAGGLLAIDVADHVHATLEFLETTQESDGHWSQNMQLDGEAFWDGIQLDETALAILLVGFARRKNVLTEEEELRLWPMVKRAAGYIARTGPATPEDRWERDGGYSPFTLAAEVTALLAAADLADRCGDPALAAFLIETADLWNAGIERWSYRGGTALAKRLCIAGYYTREGKTETRGGPPQSDEDEPPTDEDTISPDALALVRFGLRRPDDPRIVDTVKAIDSVLRVEFPTGPGWRRHKEDKYGEYADGRPRDSKGGIGRVWPLLIGERGHYELAAGRRQEAERMLRAMEAAATDTGLISEQIWDADDIPERSLYRGRPTGSACPLPWAHAEYLKLTRSLQDGRIFDMPPYAIERYGNGFVEPRLRAWRFNQRIESLPAGYRLRLEAAAPAIIQWRIDGWPSSREQPTVHSGLGIHFADLDTDQATPGSSVIFTFHWTAPDRWEGKDYRVTIADRESQSPHGRSS